MKNGAGDSLPFVVSYVKMRTCEVSLDPGVTQVRPIVPPPQLPVRPFGVATRRPAGNESLNATPVSVVELPLVMVNGSPLRILTMGEILQPLIK